MRRTNNTKKKNEVPEITKKEEQFQTQNKLDEDDDIFTKKEKIETEVSESKSNLIKISENNEYSLFDLENNQNSIKNKNLNISTNPSSSSNEFKTYSVDAPECAKLITNKISNFDNLKLTNKSTNSHIEKPRDYQIQIFDQIKAKNKNSIVFLETGKGKTFISIMLIKHLMGLDPNIRYEKKNKKAMEKKVVFLVCEVALVEQQSVVIQQNTPLHVKACSGKNMKSMKKDPETFRQNWKNYDVFVATPQVIYQLLTIGYLKISDIDLLIFDECHHADGNHPYNLVMNEFYFYYLINYQFENKIRIKLPKVLGLTASPLKRKTSKNLQEEAQKALTQICENLDAQMVIDPEVQFFEETVMNDGVYNLSQDEATREYTEVTAHTRNENFAKLKTFLIENLFDPITELCFRLSDDNEIKILMSDYSNYLNQKFSCADFLEFNKVLSSYKYLYELRKKSGMFNIYEKIQRQIFMLIENIDLHSIIHLLKDYSTHLNNFISKDKDDNDEFEDFVDFTPNNVKLLLNIIDKAFFLLNKNKDIYFYESFRLQGLKSKITEILNEEIEMGLENNKIIIFVNNRIVADFLTKIINKHLENFKYHKNYLAFSVVGVNKRKSENAINPKNSVSLLNENIEKFKNGTAQILVGTNTVEEGLDVKTCNVVMVYTELRTAKSYIQMKGRARKAGAKFLVFTPNKAKTIESIEDFVNLTRSMRNLFEENNIAKDFKKENYLDDKVLDCEYYAIKSTHAKITLRNVAVLFNEFIQILCANKKAKSVINKIDFKEYREFRGNGITTVFEATLTFRCEYPNFKFPKQISEIKSKKYIDKASAQNHCYVNFFKIAHENKIVNDYFTINLK